MKKLTILLLLLFSLESMAQNYQQNLEKYWYYRHRLKTEFMLLTDNSDIQGSNQVAENTNFRDPYNFVRWSDGVWWHGQYIAMLAIEYRLLKDNGQNYSETLFELNLALNAYDRLDISVGDCFENGYDYFDGFFLRDDQIYNEEFNSQFPGAEIINDYLRACGTQNNNNLTSQDQNIQMFLGLLLAKELVNDSWVQQKVDWIASAIVNRMHHPDFFGMEVWEILNYFLHPAEPVEGGKYIELIAYKWAHATAASRITGENEHTFNSRIAKPHWDANQNTILNHYTGKISNNISSSNGDGVRSGKDLWSPYAGYMTATLSTLCNEPGGGEDNVYEWLIRLYEDTKGFLTMPSDIGLYPHLPLISEILDGYDGDERFTTSFLENNYLNSAPSCGAHHYDGGQPEEDVTLKPWHTMSLSCPQHNGGIGDFSGEYNMIDYMLLYNSYFHLYHSTDGFPPYMLYEGPVYYHHNFYAARQIDTKCNVYNNGSEDISVSFSAGKTVVLKPGFSVSKGSVKDCNVIVQIRPDLNDAFYYSKTNVDPCNGGEFIPQHVANNQEISTKLKSINQNHIAQKENYDNLYLNYPDNKLSNDFVVYPNPSIGLFNI